jgi:glycosyltransferase involved in cell wall biosynthesis
MTICWIGIPYFSPALATLGAEVVHLEARFPEFWTWERIVEAVGRVPDLLVLGDASLPPLLPGLESFPCPTVFYCVDSHIHSWHPLYGRAFDLCLVSLRDHLPLFLAQGVEPSRVRWSPPYSPDGDGPGPGPREWDLLFNGSVDPATTPGRKAFLEALAARTPALTVRPGPYRDFFHRARVVLNVAEAGDLNFRVFEALGCGACLVTPAVGHGLSDLFADGEDLFLYAPGDVQGVAALAARLLADQGLRERVAASGLAKVHAGHKASHRAAAFLDWVRSFPAREMVAGRLAQAPALRKACLRPLYLHWAEALSATPEAARAYLRAAMA